MAAPQLLIRKRMQLIQGKVRPCCFAQAQLPANLQAILEEHFINEPLFKRASYSANWPKGAIEIPAALAPALGAFLKNDACPEITVKTLLAGQQHQGTNTWEMLCFEFIAKLSFDNLLMLVAAARDLDREIAYLGNPAARSTEAFVADTAEEHRAIGDAGLAA